MGDREDVGTETDAEVVAGRDRTRDGKAEIVTEKETRDRDRKTGGRGREGERVGVGEVSAAVLMETDSRSGVDTDVGWAWQSVLSGQVCLRGHLPPDLSAVSVHGGE